MNNQNVFRKYPKPPSESDEIQLAFDWCASGLEGSFEQSLVNAHTLLDWFNWRARVREPSADLKKLWCLKCPSPSALGYPPVIVPKTLVAGIISPFGRSNVDGDLDFLILAHRLPQLPSVEVQYSVLDRPTFLAKYADTRADFLSCFSASPLDLLKISQAENVLDWSLDLKASSDAYTCEAVLCNGAIINYRALPGIFKQSH